MPDIGRSDLGLLVPESGHFADALTAAASRLGYAVGDPKTATQKQPFFCAGGEDGGGAQFRRPNFLQWLCDEGQTNKQRDRIVMIEGGKNVTFGRRRALAREPITPGTSTGRYRSPAARSGLQAHFRSWHW